MRNVTLEGDISWDLNPRVPLRRGQLSHQLLTQLWREFQKRCSQNVEPVGPRDLTIALCTGLRRLLVSGPRTVMFHDEGHLNSIVQPDLPLKIASSAPRFILATRLHSLKQPLQTWLELLAQTSLDDARFSQNQASLHSLEQVNAAMRGAGSVGLSVGEHHWESLHSAALFGLLLPYTSVYPES